jgi:Flp pilus assembly protein TadG
MRRLLSRWLRSTDGTAGVEFALIAPVLLLLAGATAEFGMIFQVYNATDRLAAQYAISWADCSDLPAGNCQTELATYTAPAAISNVVPQLKSANITLKMFQLQMSGTTPVVVYAYPSGATLTSQQVTAAQGVLQSGQSGVLVTATYQHSLNLFSVLMTPYLAAKLSPSYTVVQLKY